MSSPFSKAFNAKNPVTPLEGNAFIKAKIDAEAAGKKSFVVNGKNYPLKMEEGSPALAHGKKFRERAKKLSEGVEQGDYDYENKKVVELLEKAKKADASHRQERTEEDIAQVREDEDAAKASAVEMSAIKKKSAPLNASYANPQDYFYVSNAADFQNLQDNIASNTAKVLEAQGNPQKQADRLQKRIDKREERKRNPKGFDKLFGKDMSAGSKFDELTQDLVKRQKDASDRADRQAKDPCKDKSKGDIAFDSYGNSITC